eukprot:TRINITY_DN2134_c0_g1_i3.p1 TRINITY_DN2134_c0_g1~~TRINITY_DN2134_c0_g1_i3.p1  ORF type:complete len:1194 (+),score=488.42 TRINITY_DN2134_c0_g1_i3:93-3674(+)
MKRGSVGSARKPAPKQTGGSFRRPQGSAAAAAGPKQVSEAEARRRSSTGSVSSMTVAGLGGEKYEGDLNGDGRRHGHGVLVWPNGNKYVGQWSDGKMTGRGVFTYGTEGDRYEGEFMDDKKHGRGCYTFANGNRYEGDFVNDKRHGSGKYHWVCGDMYDGEWREGRMEGRGITVYANGNKYEGDFKEDRREGKGRLTCTDGLVFDGGWLNNMRHGSGVLIFPTGDRYEGEWREDKKHGNGKDVFVNGNVFEGRYENNVKHGRGTMHYANGDEYSGDWEDDKMHGKGVYRFANGFVYDGQWQHDCRSGWGVYTFPNQNRYEGEWREDKRHGRGTFFVVRTNEEYRGHWVAGRMEGDFSVCQEGRERYQGSWKGGVVCGRGTMVFGGYRFAGEWDPGTQPKKTDGTIDIPDAPPDPPPVNVDGASSASQRSAAPSAQEAALQLRVADLERSKHDLELERARLLEDRDEAGRFIAANTELRRELQAARAELEQLRGSAADSKKGAEKLQGDLRRSREEAKKLHGQLEGLRKELEAAQTQRDSKAAQISHLDKEVSSLRKEVSELGQYRRQAKELAAKLDDTGAELTRVRDESRAARERADAQDRDLKAARGQVRERDARLAEAERVRKALEEELGALREAEGKGAAERTAEIRRLSGDAEALQKQLLEAADRAAALSEENAALQRAASEAGSHEGERAETAQREGLLRQRRDAAEQHALAAERALAEQLDSSCQLAEAEQRRHLALEQELAFERTRRHLSVHSERLRRRAERAEYEERLRRAAQTAKEAERRSSAPSSALDAAQAQLATAGRRIDDFTRQVAEYQKEVNGHRREIAGLEEELGAHRAAATAARSAATEHQEVADALRKQMNELESENDQLRMQVRGLMDRPGGGGGEGADLRRLQEKIKELEKDQRLDAQELRNLREELAGERKRRKRAEKQLQEQGGGASAEALRNQLVHLRAQAEQQERDMQELREQNSRQDMARMETERQRRVQWTAPGKDHDLAWRVRYLQEQLDEKERIIEEQRLEVSRVKQLEAKLVSANQRIQGLSKSAEMDRTRELHRAVSESERWSTQEMIAAERRRISDLERRELAAINGTLKAGRGRAGSNGSQPPPTQDSFEQTRARRDSENSSTPSTPLGFRQGPDVSSPHVAAARFPAERADFADASGALVAALRPPKPPAARPVLPARHPL